MKKTYSGTGFKNVTIAFMVLIGVVLANVGFNFYLISESKNTIAKMTEVINPYIESLEKFNLMVTESKMYSTNWTYLKYSKDDEDKKELQALHKTRYPELKKELEGFLTKLDKKADRDSLRAVFKKFNDLLVVEEEIMETLASADDYEIPIKKLGCEAIIDDEVLPRTAAIKKQLSKIIKRNREEADNMKHDIEADTFKLMTIMLIASVVLFLFVIFAVYFISNAIKKPVVKMKDVVQQLSKGELTDEKVEVKENVIGEMAHAVNILADSFTKTSEFAKQIGSGNLSVNYDKLSDNDVLGNALIHMRDSLRTYADEMETKVRERTKEVLEKGVKLEHAYREIKDSISYAKRIQESILPSDQMITRVFDQSYILYKPKDIVCGDFYWYTQQGDDAVIAALDCTGHGVPGALMTVIGNSLLNQIVNFSGITSPAKILSQLDKKLQETLKQHGEIATNDGMDAAICTYNMKKKEITFAGAKRPLYIFKNSELIEIKGNKTPIGSYQHYGDKFFTEQRFNVNQSDTIYLFSDGIQDQFGGDEGKKFMIKRFRDMLKGLQPLSMKDQVASLENEIAAWQGQYEQTDDMLLIGIRF
ncbi:MAG TPA: SpoIIE family protein phosphatase [Flavobacteriales bacterium]|nr:SpoIIE family protein phosphatase [Flavobacteriales bacterium]